MSTDFYLRRTKPVLCFPQFDVGTRYGGKMQEYRTEVCSKDEEPYMFVTQRPPIRTPKDIADAARSGEWEIVDEYEVVYEPDEFMKIAEKGEGK